jgi:hypothetical protein
MSADWCADILQETIQKYGVPEILIQIKEVNTPVRSHQCIIKQWNKKFLWTVKDELLTTFLLKDYGGQSNTRMYIYKHILTESAFTEDLKIILNFIIHGDFISH